MTVASSQSRKTFAGDNVSTSFGTTPVVFFETSNLVIYVTDDVTGAATTLVENTDYTVSGGSGAVGTISLAGGSDPWGALASGTTLVVVRELPIVQEADPENNDLSDADVIEQALDRANMVSQQLSTRIDRSIVFDDSVVSTASTTLPSPSADAFLGWNDDATALENKTLTDISLITLPLAVTQGGTGAVTAVSARTALGALSADGDDITTVVPTTSDLVLFADATDSNLVKKATVADVLALEANSGVTSNTYTLATVTVNSKGRVISASNGTAAGITQGTSQATTSGTVKDFTGIPAGTKRIVVSLHGVSTNGSSDYLIQIGDSGGIENTGYNSQACDGGTPTTSTAGFLITDTVAAGRSYYGTVILTLVDAATFTWAATGNIVADTGAAVAFYSAGGKALSAELDRVRLTSVTPDTFDAGMVNIQYE